MSDVLMRDAPLRERVELPVLGVHTVFETDDRRLREVVETTFGPWAALSERPELFSEDRVRVRLWLDPAAAASGGSPEILYRMPDSERLMVMGRGSAGSADAHRSESVGYVSRALLDDPLVLSESFLQPLTYFLVARPPRYAFHAAAVVSGDSAVLLCGEGGTGKSTLTWACAERGLGVLSEDVVYLQSDPDPIVWGFPGPVHIPIDSVRFFPGVGDGPTIVAGGREKLVLSPDPESWPVAVRSAAICMLRAGGDTATLERVPMAEIVDRLGDSAEPGFDFYSVRTVLEDVIDGDGWRLTLGPDPHAAAGIIEELLEAAP